MGRINKPNKTTPVSADEFIIYDSEDTSDDKNVTLGQIATFTESQNSTVTGTKIFTDGVELQKGSIAFGQYSPLPTTVGSYVAQYVSPTYGPRLLGYNGSAYQDLSIGSMPTAGTFSIKSLANGDCNFGYNVNIAEDLGVTGDVTASSFVGDGSQLTNIGAKIVSCSTAAATAAKTATLSGITIEDDVHFYVKFTNANTSATITLNINSEGDWDIYDLKGNQITGDYFSNADDETVLLKADKTNTRFILVNAPFWESRMATPSNIYIDLTLGASGSSYTAPADGYVTITKTSNANNQFITLSNITNKLSIVAHVPNATNGGLVFLPVKKNDVIQCIYTLGGATDYFRFIYSEGSKP